MLSPQDHLLRRTSSATFDLPVSHLPTHASPVHTGGLTSPTSGLGGTLKVDADGASPPYPLGRSSARASSEVSCAPG